MMTLFSETLLADGGYERDKICSNSTVGTECDELIEQAVIKDLPLVIKRNGPAITIQTKNKNIIERSNSASHNEGHKEIWLCDYLQKYGYIRLCYRFWESSGTEYVNIHTGDVKFLNGWPYYSPSGERVLMVAGYAGEVYGVEIWRFAKEQMVNEYHLGSPKLQGWEGAVWKGENMIVPIIEYRPEKHPSHLFIKDNSGWGMRENN
jgi:hypothetical protein